MDDKRLKQINKNRVKDILIGIFDGVLLAAAIIAALYIFFVAIQPDRAEILERLKEIFR